MVCRNGSHKVVRVTPYGQRIDIGIYGTLEACEAYCDLHDWEWNPGTGIINGLNVVPILE